VTNRLSTSSNLTNDDIRIYSASEVLGMEFKDATYAVNGLLQEGVTILSGSPKIGKSWLALNLSLAVASGGLALGTIAVDRGEVLYLALEDGLRRLNKRLKMVLNDDAVPAQLYLSTQWQAIDRGGLAAIEEWLREHPQARLIIVDTLKRIRPVEGNRASRYDVDYDAIAPFADLALNYGIAILIVHHNRKQQADDPLDMVSGSTGLTGAADAALVMQRQRGTKDASLLVTGRDIEERELALQWDAPFARWLIVGNAIEAYRSAERNEIIGQMKRMGEPMSPKEVAEAINRNPDNIRQLMWKMSKDGDLRTCGGGKYAITDNTDNTDNSIADEGDDNCYRVTDVIAYPAIKAPAEPPAIRQSVDM
jgi:AAA domain